MAANLDLAQLGQIPVFADLPDSDLGVLRLLAQRVELGAEATLFNQGDPADALFVVLTGNLDIHVRVGGGREHLVAQMGPGNVVGEISLFIGGLRSASARTTAPTELLRFPDDSLRAMMGTAAASACRIIYRLAQALAARLRAADAHIAEMSREDRAAVFDDDLDRLRRIFFTDWALTATKSPFENGNKKGPSPL